MSHYTIAIAVILRRSAEDRHPIAIINVDACQAGWSSTIEHWMQDTTTTQRRIYVPVELDTLNLPECVVIDDGYDKTLLRNALSLPFSCKNEHWDFFTEAANGEVYTPQALHSARMLALAVAIQYDSTPAVQRCMRMSHLAPEGHIQDDVVYNSVWGNETHAAQRGSNGTSLRSGKGKNEPVRLQDTLQSARLVNGIYSFGGTLPEECVAALGGKNAMGYHVDPKNAEENCPLSLKRSEESAVLWVTWEKDGDIMGTYELYLSKSVPALEYMDVNAESADAGNEHTVTLTSDQSARRRQRRAYSGAWVEWSIGRRSSTHATVRPLNDRLGEVENGKYVHDRLSRATLRILYNIFSKEVRVHAGGEYIDDRRNRPTIKALGEISAKRSFNDGPIMVPGRGHVDPKWQNHTHYAAPIGVCPPHATEGCRYTEYMDTTTNSIYVSAPDLPEECILTTSGTLILPRRVDRSVVYVPYEGKYDPTNAVFKISGHTFVIHK